MNAGASLSAVPSPIEGSGTAWVLLGSWALSPARPTPIPPRHECRGFSALLVRARWWTPPRTASVVEAWIRREFAVRSLAPPDCTPAALARALERERQITIAFRPHVSEDPGVSGMLARLAACPDTYIILFRASPSRVLRRLILFHELAHLLFDHALIDVVGIDGL